MTDLLSRPRPEVPGPPGSSRAPAASRRPEVAALWAGLAAPGSVLALCAAVALAGWFASDGGQHGTPRDALRVGADAWLLAHGARLDLAGAVVTAAPLGLTVLALYAAYRAGRWAARSSAVGRARDLAVMAGVLAVAYGAVAALTAILAATPTAEPGVALAWLGGVLVGGVGGGLGLASGAGRVASWCASAPPWLVSAGLAAVAGSLLCFAAGGLLTAGALALDFPAAANVLSELRAGLSGGLFSVLLVALAAPNLCLLGAAYLLGPGFSVGTGTLVSPSEVVLGPVPALPVLAALPDEGVAPRWVLLLVGVPVLAGVVAGAAAGRAVATQAYEQGILRGLLGGVAGGLLLGLLVSAAGGAVGPGRMADVGASGPEVLLSAVVALGVGGAVGGLGSTWWQRRRAR